MLLPVGAGGAAGACLRYGVWVFVSERSPEHPHVATLVVNVFGSVALGLLAGLIVVASGGAGGGPGVARPGGASGWLEAGVMVGLIGALTTYSTFAVDAVKLLHAGRVGHAAGYVAATTVLCLAGAGLAYWGVVRAAGSAGAGV